MTEVITSRIVTEQFDGIPCITVAGTPRAMGHKAGRFFAAQATALLDSIRAEWQSHCRTNTADLAGFFAALQSHLQQRDPAYWMELEAFAAGSGLSTADVLWLVAYHDVLSLIGNEQPAQPSAYVSVPASKSASGVPYLGWCQFFDARMMPAVAFVRRVPSHGPATLSLTLGGMMTLAGISATGVAVAANELRVNDAGSGTFTTHQLAGMLASPAWSDVVQRASQHPRVGGAALHALAATGERFTYEASGQQGLMLADPLPSAPRVHTNHFLADTLTALHPTSSSSRQRLSHLAGQAINGQAVTPAQIDGWLSLPRHPVPEVYAQQRQSIPWVVAVCDPRNKTLHVRRSDVVGLLETVPLT